MFLRVRSTGRFLATILSMKEILMDGKECAIMQLKEDDYIDRIINGLNEHGVDNVKYERVTSLVPRDNIEVEYDWFCEPISVKVLPQSEKFLGWKLWRNKSE